MVFAGANSALGDPKTPLSQKPRLTNDEWKRLISRISEISKMMMNEGMPLAYHHHIGTKLRQED